MTNFVAVDANIWGMSVTLTLDRYGQKRTFPVDFRIDAREGGFRTDIHTIGPWEAIDGGKPFENINLAKSYIRRYVKEIQKQNTLHPKM